MWLQQPTGIVYSRAQDQEILQFWLVQPWFIFGERSTLFGLRVELQGLRAFGTDGEKALALVNAFSHEFRYTICLTCFIHFRQNIKRKLQELQYPDSVIKGGFLGDIFGCTQRDSEGLVDSNSDEEFDKKLFAETKVAAVGSSS